MIRPPRLAALRTRPQVRRRAISMQARSAGDDSGSTIGLPPPPGSASSSFSNHPFSEPFAESAPLSSADPRASDAIKSDGSWNPDNASLDSRSFETAQYQLFHEDETPSTAVTQVPLPQPGIVPLRRRRQPFDTHSFVSRLEDASVPPHAAKALMESVRGLVTERTDRVMYSMLSKEEQDNEAYLYRAALSKLRTEFNVRNKNTGIAARNAVSAIRRELDGVEVKMQEDVQMLKHDIELDMNNRKVDTRTDMKWADIAIEEINNRATISIGDLKTEIESAKWEATRRAITIIMVLVVAGVGISTFTIPEAATEPPPAAKPKEPPSTRDMGIGTDEDPFDYESRIDKLLNQVEQPPPKRERRPSRPDFAGRI